MTTRFLGLRTCIYLVSDLDAAKKWYTDVFAVPPYFDQPFYVGFNIGGFELGLLPEEGPAGKKVPTVKTYWGVQDIQEVFKHLLDLGAQPDEEPTDVGDGVMVATVVDPWGNLLGIIYNPFFGKEA